MKSPRPWSYLLSLQLPLQIVIGYQLQFNYLSPLLCFVFIPIADWVLGDDQHAQKKEKSEEFASRMFYQILLYLWAPIQIGFVGWGAYVVTHDALSWGQLIAFVISIATLTGSGIIVAHELGHHPNKWDQWLAKVILSTVGYMHFFIEHNQSHHTHVGTPKDSAYSKQGESFYQFYPRAVRVGGGECLEN